MITECTIATVNLTDDVALAIANAQQQSVTDATDSVSGLGKRNSKPSSNPVTAGQLAAVAYGHGMDYEGAFRNYPVVGKFVATSNILHDAFREIIDQPGADTLWLSLSSAASVPSFRLHTTSSFGTCTIDFDRRSEAFKSFEISLSHRQSSSNTINATPNETTLDGDISHSYRLNLFGPTVRTLDTATETFLGVNSVGMLHMAHRIAIDSLDGNPVAAFVTFCFMPDDEDLVSTIENNMQELHQTIPYKEPEEGNDHDNQDITHISPNSHDKRQRREHVERYDSPSYDDTAPEHEKHNQSYELEHHDDNEENDDDEETSMKHQRNTGFVRNLLNDRSSLPIDNRSIITGIIDNEEVDDE